MLVRSLKELETHRRIKLSVWAYAYEFLNKTLVPDCVFDYESILVDLNIRTNRPDLDMFFVLHFQPHTGLWIHQHPELEKVQNLYERFYKC